MALAARMLRYSCSATAFTSAARTGVMFSVRPAHFSARGFRKPNQGRNWFRRNQSESAAGNGAAGKKKESFFAWYNRMLEENPYPTKMVTSGVLFGAGDGIAQLIAIYQKDGVSFDIPRFLRATAFGFIFLGPLAHLHFNFLEYLVVQRLAVGATMMPFVKMGIEQFTYWAPGVNAFYHFILGIMEGIGVSESIDRVKERWIPTMKANYMLWPLAQLINFKLVPIAHQLNFVLVVSLGWAVFLSQLGAKASEGSDEK